MTGESDILVTRLLRSQSEQAKLARTTGALADELCSRLVEEIPAQPGVNLASDPRAGNMLLARVALTGIATSFDNAHQLLCDPDATQRASQIMHGLRLGAAVLALREPENHQIVYQFGRLQSAIARPNTSAAGLDVDMTIADAADKTSRIIMPLGDILTPRLIKPPLANLDLYFGQETIGIIDSIYGGAPDDNEAVRHHILSEALLRSGLWLTALGYTRTTVNDKLTRMQQYFESPGNEPYSGYALRLPPLGIPLSVALRRAVKLGANYSQLKPKGKKPGTLGYDIRLLRSMSRHPT